MNSIRFSAIPRYIPLSILSCLLLAACSFRAGMDDTEWFDLGVDTGVKAEAAQTGTATPPLTSPSTPILRAWNFEVRSDIDLSDGAMRYRLEYIKPGGIARVLNYSRSRWALPPAEILRRRLAEYLFWADNAKDRCNLVLNLTRFEQIFPTPEKSYGVIAVEARLLNTVTGALEDEARFVRKVPAPTPDAVGGVEALAEGAKLLALQDLRQWREAGKADRQRGCWQSGEFRITKPR